MPASYLEIHIAIDSSGRLSTKTYDQRDDFIFPIPAAPAYRVYLTVDMTFLSLSFLSYFLDRGLLLTRKLLNQGFHVVKLKSLRRFYCRRTCINKHYRISV